MKKAAPVLERDIMNDVCLYLKSHNYFFWRSNNIPVFGKNNAGKMTFRSMPKFSMKGVPDIILVLDGKFIGIEVKREKAKLRPDQYIYKALLEAHGGIYLVVHSLKEIEDIFRERLFV